MDCCSRKNKASSSKQIKCGTFNTGKMGWSKQSSASGSGSSVCRPKLLKSLHGLIHHPLMLPYTLDSSATTQQYHMIGCMFLHVCLSVSVFKSSHSDKIIKHQYLECSSFTWCSIFDSRLRAFAKTPNPVLFVVNDIESLVLIHTWELPRQPQSYGTVVSK